LQLIERFGLRRYGMAGWPLVQGVGGAAHGALGPTQRLRDIAALLAELAHHVAEHAAQRFLVAGEVAVALLPLALLAALTLAVLAALAALPGLALARLPEAAVEKLLLALHHLLHLAHRLALAALHLALLCRLQILKHLLELRKHVAGGIARSGARQLARTVEHALQIVATEHARGIHRLLVLALIALPLHVLGERLEVAVDRLLQTARELLDFGIGRVAGERVLKRLHGVAQIALDERAAPIFDAHRRLPEQLLDLRDRTRILIEDQPSLRRPQAQEHDGVVAEQPRPQRQVRQGLGDDLALARIERQLLALIDDGARHRIVEGALRQRDAQGIAVAGLAERVDRLEVDIDRQPGPGMRRQVVVARIARLFEVLAGQGQVERQRSAGVARA